MNSPKSRLTRSCCHARSHGLFLAVILHCGVSPTQASRNCECPYVAMPFVHNCSRPEYVPYQYPVRVHNKCQVDAIVALRDSCLVPDWTYLWLLKANTTETYDESVPEPVALWARLVDKSKIWDAPRQTLDILGDNCMGVVTDLKLYPDAPEPNDMWQVVCGKVYHFQPPKSLEDPVDIFLTCD